MGGPPRDRSTSEAPYRHFPETPSHTYIALQKVSDWVIWFAGLRIGITTIRKILLASWLVKGKRPSPLGDCVAMSLRGSETTEAIP